MTLKITIVNSETGETETRDMTKDELKQHEIDSLAFETKLANAKKIEALRQSRRDKLIALGLTEDELNA
jgi:hypothetical protein